MKIEHVAMYVNDLEGAKEFFTKYFGAKANDGYTVADGRRLLRELRHRFRGEPDRDHGVKR